MMSLHSWVLCVQCGVHEWMSLVMWVTDGQNWHVCSFLWRAGHHSRVTGPTIGAARPLKAPVVDLGVGGRRVELIMSEKSLAALNKKRQIKRERESHPWREPQLGAHIAHTAENEAAASWFVPNKVVTSDQDSHLLQKAQASSQDQSGGRPALDKTSEQSMMG